MIEMKPTPSVLPPGVKPLIKTNPLHKPESSRRIGQRTRVYTQLIGEKIWHDDQPE